MDQLTLVSLWNNSREKKTADSESWSRQLEAIYACGKGLGETLQYLYGTKPSLDAFLTWMEEGGACSVEAQQVEDVLSPEDLQAFLAEGYLVFRGAVSTADCAAARWAIDDYLGVNPHNAATWYGVQGAHEGMMVPLYQHEALQSNRQSPRIRKAFEQLYGTAAIHPVVDKVSFNPPVSEHHSFNGSPLHWDVSLAQPIPFKLQGLLYLSDCPADGGAFHCVPGFHHTIGDWLGSLPLTANPRDEAIRQLQPLAIEGKTGDLVIWHQALPHCATSNRSQRPRYVQYITYDPDGYRGGDLWI